MQYALVPNGDWLFGLFYKANAAKQTKIEKGWFVGVEIEMEDKTEY